MQKEYQLAVDIEKKILTPSFEVNTLDLKTIKLKITITKGMTLVDLTDIVVRMSIRKPDGNVLFQDCQVVNAKAGQVEIVLENQAYLIPGTYSSEIMCFKGSDKVAVTGSFSYRSIKGIMDDKAVESKSEFTAITKQLDDVQATVNDLRENGTGIDAQARQEVEQVSAQLTETSQQVGVLYDDLINVYGAVGDGITDDTAALQRAAASGKHVGFPKGIYLITSTLVFEKGTSFIGISSDVQFKITKDIDLFKLCYRSTLQNIKLDFTSIPSYTKDVIEISSGTMQGKSVPLFENMQIVIDNIEAKFSNTKYTTEGTFLHVWAAKTDEEGRNYTNYGFWGVKVRNVLVGRNLGFFCRNWMYRANGQTSSQAGWITNIFFENVTIYTAKYGFFGSKSEATMTNKNYYDASLTLDKVTMQYDGSSMFAFFTDGAKVLKNTMLFDFPTKPISLLYRETAPSVPKPYSYKINFDYEYGDLLERVNVYDAPNDLNKTNYILNSFSKFDNNFRSLSSKMVSGEIATTGSVTYPSWYRVSEKIRPVSAGGFFTASFLVNMGYLAAGNKGMTIVTMTCNDTNMTDQTVNPKLIVQTNPYVPQSDFGEFYIIKTVLGNYVKYEIFLKFTSGTLGAGGYYIALNPPIETNPYNANVYIEQVGDQSARKPIIGDYSGYQTLPVPVKPGDPAGAKEGFVYFNSSTKKHRGFNGTSWFDFY